MRRFLSVPFRTALALGALTLAVAGCDGGDPDDDGGGDLRVELDAGGVHYETATTGGIENDGTFTFGAEFDDDGTTGMVLTAPLQEGTFAAGGDSGVYLIFNNADNSFGAGGTRGNGSVHVTSVDGDVVRGTFAFNALSVDGTNTPIAVTGGSFAVEIVVH